MICRICDNFACFCPNREYGFMSEPEFGSKNKKVPRGIHVMNKDEAKLCRRLMAETGLTEKELREHKKYRIMLSEAQKEGQNGLDRIEKLKKRYMKMATKETGLAKRHPKTLEVYERMVKSYNRWYHFDIININYEK